MPPGRPSSKSLPPWAARPPLAFAPSSDDGAVAQDAESSSAQAPRPATEAADSRVLVIEDDPVMRQVIAFKLRGMPQIDVRCAGSVAEAKAMIAQEEPHLCFVDLLLPDGDGIEVLENLRETWPDALCVVTTSYATADSAIAALRGQAFDFLRKPLADIQDLQEVAERALEVSRLRRERAELVAELREANGNLTRVNRELVIAKEELVLSEKLAGLGYLAAGIAHEVNNPGMIALGHLEALRDELALLAEEAPGGRSAAMRESLGHVNDAVHRIVDIGRHLKVFARDEHMSRRAIDVNEIVDAAAGVLRGRVRGEVRLISALGHPPAVSGDRRRLSAVIVNLLANALEAFDETGEDRARVVLETSAATSDGKPEAVIVIEDCGRGIDAEALRHIFDPFFTTKEAGQGAGLGLSVCHGVIAKHGGSIHVDSTPGKGTRVTIRLPAAEVTPEAAKSEVRAMAPMVPERPVIVIVDDEPALLLLYRRMLRNAEVHCCSEGDAALALFAELPRVDAVICDLVMPSMSGELLFQEVHRRFPELCERFVFATGGARTGSESAFILEQTQPVLAKPFGRDELLETLAEIVGPWQ